MRILVVDALQPSRRALRPVLGALGEADIAECACAESAMEEALRNPPGLIVVVATLPGADAIDLLRRLSAGGVPAMLIDTDPSRDRVFDALRAGASNIVRAPWTPDLLRQRIDETLAQARGAR